MSHSFGLTKRFLSLSLARCNMKWENSLNAILRVPLYTISNHNKTADDFYAKISFFLPLQIDSVEFDKLSTLKNGREYSRPTTKEHICTGKVGKKT